MVVDIGGQDSKVIRLDEEGMVADRLAGMVHRVGLARDVVMTGGVSRNDGVRLSLERKLAPKVLVPSMSQYDGAYGASIIAHESAARDR